MAVFMSGCSFNIQKPLYEDEYIIVRNEESQCPIEGTTINRISLKVKNKSDEPVYFSITGIEVNELGDILNNVDNDDIEVSLLSAVSDEMLYPNKSEVYDLSFTLNFGDETYSTYEYYKLLKLKCTEIVLEISTKNEEDVLLNTEKIFVRLDELTGNAN